MNARLYINDLSKDMQAELFNIWHLSKIHSHKRYDRLNYTVKMFLKIIYIMRIGKYPYIRY